MRGGQGRSIKTADSDFEAHLEYAASATLMGELSSIRALDLHIYLAVRILSLEVFLAIPVF